MNENIGINAGKIWQYLEANGESKVIRVKRNLNLSTDELYLALGWLARENNVAFCRKDSFLWVKLV
ncbi:MAG: winged helix-turn-helix domain-containing protein [Candidatus Gastranaerophilaceae bacterium]